MPSTPDRYAAPVLAAPVLLRVDRVACSAHGVCASLLPGNVQLDEWGYPIIVNPRVGSEPARTAVRLCPARALYVRSP